MVLRLPVPEQLAHLPFSLPLVIPWIACMFEVLQSVSRISLTNLSLRSFVLILPTIFASISVFEILAVLEGFL